MKRLSWSLSAGIVILVAGTIALFLSAGVVKFVRAQNPPTNDLPPPAADLPPMGDLPPDPQMTAPPADLPPPAPGTAGQPGMPPAMGNPPMPQNPGEAPQPPALDAGQDPGLKPSNPEGYLYDPSGRRDPFLPPNSLAQPTEAQPPLPPGVLPAQPLQAESPDNGENLGNGDPLLSYYLKDFKLIGVLWDVHDPKAMVRAPNSKVFTVRLRTKVGRESAVVAAIREKEVVFVEPDSKGDYKKGEARTLKLRN